MFIKELFAKKYFTILIIVLPLFFQQCNYFKSDKKEKPLARVYDEYLYSSDLKSLFPKKTSKADSIAFLNNYINSWVHNRLELKTAEKNLTANQKDFEKQLTEYRNSLIIYTYESELIRQKLSENITDDAITNYYNKNKANFLLKDNIVKVIYVKTPLKTASINKIKTLYKSEKDDDIFKLKEICDKEAVNFFLDDVWLVFNDLIKEIPIKTYNQEEFLKSNHYVEMKDSLYNYFLNIRGYKIKESVSPLSMEKENIKNILINTQKIELIKKNQDEIFSDAVKKNNFEIYTSHK